MLRLRVETLTPEWREVYEERAAVREFDGKMPRKQAEKAALEDLERMMRESRLNPPRSVS